MLLCRQLEKKYMPQDCFRNFRVEGDCSGYRTTKILRFHDHYYTWDILLMILPWLLVKTYYRESLFCTYTSVQILMRIKKNRFLYWYKTRKYCIIWDKMRKSLFISFLRVMMGINIANTKITIKSTSLYQLSAAISQFKWKTFYMCF